MRHLARPIESSLFLLVGVITALIGIAISEYVVMLDRERNEQFMRAHTVEQLATLRARLEGELNSTLHLTRGLIAYVSTHPDLNNAEFEQLAAELVSVGRHIRNIGLAPNNRINYVYPLIGNERAIGIRYADLPAQWPAVKRAMDLGSTVVAGPVNLVQGGQALIARTPIYIRHEQGGSMTRLDYWGIASIVLHMNSLFQAAGIGNSTTDIQLAIRGKDAMGAQGGMIYGDPALFDNYPVLQEVMLPNGAWQLAALPSEEWSVTNNDVLWRRGLGWTTSFIIAVLIALLLRARHNSQQLSLHDQLTGLPNRRLLDDRLQQLQSQCNRHGGSFTLLYLDLNGFKQVNDQNGHYVGDLVLREIGQRLLANMRKSDTVSRIGGDEFLIVLADSVEPGSVKLICTKLRQHIARPIMAGGQQFTLGVSIGVARYPTDAIDLDRLVAIADKRMYAGKQADGLPTDKVTPIHRA